jgi:hypothetical protein
VVATGVIQTPAHNRRQTHDDWYGAGDVDSPLPISEEKIVEPKTPAIDRAR